MDPWISRVVLDYYTMLHWKLQLWGRITLWNNVITPYIEKSCPPTPKKKKTCIVFICSPFLFLEGLHYFSWKCVGMKVMMKIIRFFFPVRNKEEWWGNQICCFQVLTMSQAYVRKITPYRSFHYLHASTQLVFQCFILTNPCP